MPILTKKSIFKGLVVAASIVSFAQAVTLKDDIAYLETQMTKSLRWSQEFTDTTNKKKKSVFVKEMKVILDALRSHSYACANPTATSAPRTAKALHTVVTTITTALNSVYSKLQASDSFVALLGKFASAGDLQTLNLLPLLNTLLTTAQRENPVIAQELQQLVNNVLTPFHTLWASKNKLAYTKILKHRTTYL